MQILHDLGPDRSRLLSGSVADRIELRLEQVDEPRGDLRVRGHRIVPVLLRESRGDPHPIRAIRAEDVDLPPGQTAHDHQAVEGIHLRLAAPHRAERVADRLGGALEIEHRTASVQDAEVVDEDPSFALQVDGDLLDDAETERLEQRHEGRKVDLASGLVEAHPREPLARRLVSDPNHEAVRRRGQLFHVQHVVDGQRPVGVGGFVVIGEAWCVRRGECAATLLAESRGQRVGEVVVPRAREPFDLRFQFLVRDLGDPLARLDVHGEEDLGGLGLPQGEVVVHGGAVEALHEHGLQAFAEPRGEPLTR